MITGFFANTKKILQLKIFGSNEKVIDETEAYFESKDKTFFTKVIKMLEERWNEYIGISRSHCAPTFILEEEYVDD